METAHPGYIEDKEDLKKRLRRVAGQVNGIERMVEEERYCIDILTQISAIRSALDRVAIAVLDDHARHCVVDAAAGQRDERTTEMMDAVARLLKSRCTERRPGGGSDRALRPCRPLSWTA
jgi:DNA-binding FrmR family transcriptional regulator